MVDAKKIEERRDEFRRFGNIILRDDEAPRYLEWLAERALSERGEERGWMPIETAPKDGTAFLALVGAHPTTIFWSGRAWDLCVGSNDLDASEPPPPHAWQPLPAPPASIRTGGDND